MDPKEPALSYLEWSAAHPFGSPVPLTITDGASAPSFLRQLVSTRSSGPALQEAGRSSGAGARADHEAAAGKNGSTGGPESDLAETRAATWQQDAKTAPKRGP